jgi:HAE1 family hydrophobic/amphiphilic exporter-1
MFLSDVSIKRPVFATMMMVALVVFGLVGFSRLAVDEYPDVSYPVISVNTNYPGASPEVVEREITRPIEQALNTVEGLQEISSTSSEGSSSVRLNFNLGVDPVRMQPEISTKVARIRRQLPRDILDPQIMRFDPNDSPIMTIALTSTSRSLREVSDIADQVIRLRVESVPGVGGVNINGAANRQIRVELDPVNMRAFGVTPNMVMTALANENQDVPAGRIIKGDGERFVRITGKLVDPLAFRDVVVQVRNGAPVRVRDIGRVVDTVAEKRSVSLLRGVPSVSVEVLKISGSNTVEVVERVSTVVAEIERTLPEDLKLEVVRDNAKHIREALADVELTIVLGAVLTIAIIYLFLNSWRSTVITGLTLPVSIISAFFIMWAFGFTLNTMTLMALSLAIGLLIDDAIVVRENIVRHVAMGKDHHRAAKDGTDEIGLAVLSTSLAVIAVFIPVAFMGGMIGKMFYQFGVTVAFAVLVSLFVSFTLDPMLSSIWHDPDASEKGEEAWKHAGPFRKIALAFDERFERLASRYPGWLRWSLAHRPVIVGGAAVSIVTAFVLLRFVGFTWMPDYDSGEFNVNFRTIPGTSVAYQLARGQTVDEYLKRNIPEVDFTQLNVGGGGPGMGRGGNVYVRLKPKSSLYERLVKKEEGRTRSMFEIQTAIRPQLGQFPGARSTIGATPSMFGGRGAPITINVQGPEPARLKLVAAQVLDAARRTDGMAEPQSSDDGDIPQLDVRVDRQQAWAAGLGIGTIASTLQPLFTGGRATTWQDPQGYSRDVVVIYPDSLRETAGDVADIPLASTGIDGRTGRQASVPLAQVADFRTGIGPQTIQRLQLERQIQITAQVLPGAALGDVASRVQSTIDSLALPAGYRTKFGGDVKNLNETKGYVLQALALAVVFIYLILASLFGSFIQPLSIMLSLPLSFLGVVLALLVTRGTLNVMSMIGIIMLMGLVTKNGILLIDFVNQRRAEGESRLDAILQSGRTRLRPIIMTTMSMIFGMLPLAFAIGEGAEQRAPMAHAVIGGLITSTLLTLFVVPIVYTLLDDATSWLGSRRRSSSPKRAETVPALADANIQSPA